MRDSILEKIKKLLAVGERAASEAEAHAAMGRAQALLAKHNLSMADVDAHDSTQAENIELDDSLPASKRLIYWQMSLYTSVAMLYFCKYFRRSKYCPTAQSVIAKHMVVGRTSNVAIVHYIAQYLIRTCDALADSRSYMAARESQSQGIPFSNRAWKGSFRLGFSDRIRERARVEIEKAKSGGLRDEHGTALILANLYERESKAIEAALAEQKVKSGTFKSSSSAGSAEGYRAGVSAANKANLQSNGVCTNSPSPQQITFAGGVA